MNALEQFEEKVLLDRSQKLLNKLSQRKKRLEADYRWYMMIIAIKTPFFRRMMLYLIFKGGLFVTFLLLLISFGFGYNFLTSFTTLHWISKGLICTITFFLYFFYTSKSTLLENSDRWLLIKIKKTETALEQIGNAIDLLKKTPKNKPSLEPVLEKIEDEMLEMEEIRWKNK